MEVLFVWLSTCRFDCLHSGGSTASTELVESGKEILFWLYVCLMPTAAFRSLLTRPPAPALLLLEDEGGESTTAFRDLLGFLLLWITEACCRSNQKTNSLIDKRKWIQKLIYSYLNGLTTRLQLIYLNFIISSACKSPLMVSTCIQCHFKWQLCIYRQ